MATDDRMKIEGEATKPYKLYRVGPDDEIVQLVAEADSRQELSKLHKRRLDWHYKIYHNQKQID
jgi:hypothetical protein